MSKQELPQCSMEGCFNVAGVIFDGTMLCPEHANEALERPHDTSPECGGGEHLNDDWGP
jgi:hypothetical protein